MIQLFILTIDKIVGFSHETTDINLFRIRVSEAVLDICACAKQLHKHQHLKEKCNRFQVKLIIILSLDTVEVLKS